MPIKIIWTLAKLLSVQLQSNCQLLGLIRFPGRLCIKCHSKCSRDVFLCLCVRACMYLFKHALCACMCMFEQVVIAVWLQLFLVGPVFHLCRLVSLSEFSFFFFSLFMFFILRRACLSIIIVLFICEYLQRILRTYSSRTHPVIILGGRATINAIAFQRTTSARNFVSAVMIVSIARICP